jgi:hypothetical protein
MSDIPRHDLRPWNLQEIVRALNSRIDGIKAVYLFGSRAYRTNSFRSDIDLLVVVEQAIARAAIAPWVHENFNPVDLFETFDCARATSLMNGSSVVAEDGDLVRRLDAVLLWSRERDFSEEFEFWDQFALSEANFAMTILPLAPNVVELARSFARHLADEGYPNTFLGSNWATIGSNLSDIVAGALDTRTKLGERARSITRAGLTIRSEADFQNLIHLVLRPWLPTLDPENYVVTYQEQRKNADFSIDHNSIVVEAKYMGNNDQKREVLKDLEGLKIFYRYNPNVRLLLFWILVEEDVELDFRSLEADFSDDAHSPVVIVRCFRNVPPV